MKSSSLFASWNVVVIVGEHLHVDDDIYGIVDKKKITKWECWNRYVLEYKCNYISGITTTIIPVVKCRLGCIMTSWGQGGVQWCNCHSAISRHCGTSKSFVFQNHNKGMKQQNRMAWSLILKNKRSRRHPGTSTSVEFKNHNKGLKQQNGSTTSLWHQDVILGAEWHSSGWMAWSLILKNKRSRRNDNRV